MPTIPPVQALVKLNRPVSSSSGVAGDMSIVNSAVVSRTGVDGLFGVMTPRVSSVADWALNRQRYQLIPEMIHLSATLAPGPVHPIILEDGKAAEALSALLERTS